MMTMPVALVSAALAALLPVGQANLPTTLAPLRNTFVVAAETVIDAASALDLKSEDALFNAQMQQVRSAKENLKSMADDERERDAASATDDLIFAVAACRIQAKNGASMDKCQAQIASSRTRAMEALRVHKSDGRWVAGPPSPSGER